MIVIEYMIAWTFILFIIFFIFYLAMAKNGKPARKRGAKKKEKKKYSDRVDDKLGYWKSLVIPTKKFIPFLPLIPFFIVVYIFLNHYVFFAVVTSDSMAPTFEKGDIILMQSVDTSVEDDDIIMYSNKNPRGEHPPVIHRAYNVTDEGIITKGDATNKTDEFMVEPDEVKAKAVSILDNKPIVIKGVGKYFIEHDRTTGRYQNEFVFSSLLVTTLKDVGIAAFVVCVGAYIVLTIRDIHITNKKSNGR